jgi:hypothetical protein
LVTSGIKEYVLALCVLDSLIHPSILFPWHFAALGLCAWPLQGKDSGLVFLFLGVKISGEIFASRFLAFLVLAVLGVHCKSKARIWRP